MKALRTVSLLAPVLLAACGGASSSDDQPSCSLLGCAEAFVVELDADPPNGEWPAGLYRVEVTVDAPVAGTYACEIMLPSDCGTTPTCDSGMEFEVGHAGCAGPDSGQVLSDVYLPEATELDSLPTEVAIEVFYDGVSLGSESFTPQYESFYPNGEECDDFMCHQAPTATMSLQF